jgi:hypothetical protein
LKDKAAIIMTFKTFSAPFELPAYRQISFQDISDKVPLTAVVHSDFDDYLSPVRLFITCYNKLPHSILELSVDSIKAQKWFHTHYAEDIRDYYYTEKNNKKSETYNDFIYFLYDDLIIHFDVTSPYIRILYKDTAYDKVETLLLSLRKFRLKWKKDVPKINILISENGRFQLKKLHIKKPKLNIDDNYNDDFKEVHKTILIRLSDNNDKGIVLLHGKPGTGKTSYIRYLACSIKKNIYFLPLNIAENLTRPEFLSTLISMQNSILVIEDAENIITDRERKGHSSISALLNISDGLLADCLNIQIICSFNTDISKVDSALLRKGRLIARYEFKELEKEKTQKLSDKLGFQSIINKPMTLTEIYNQQEMDFRQSKTSNPIGFKTQNHM